MYANLSFADLEGGLSLTSLNEGIIGFFLVWSKYFLTKILSGKYLEEFLTSEYSLKKNFTILSSIEWKVTTAINPPIGNMLYAFINPFISSEISLFTNILSAWKILVELFFPLFFFFILSIISTRFSVSIFLLSLTFTIFFDIGFAYFSSPKYLKIF